MELKKKKQAKNKTVARKRINVWVACGAIVFLLVGFLVWLGASVIGADTNLEPVSDYKLPDFAKIEDLPSIDYGDFAVAIDGKIVASKNFGSDVVTTRPTASTAKMILALAVMKKKPFAIGEAGEEFTINWEMFDNYLYYLAHNGSNTKVMVDESISEYDALVATLLASSNNMADALAMWAFGSIDSYREYATDMLKEWGIKNTTIGEDASGFNESTTSTADDLARIGDELMKEPVLAEIVSKKEAEIPVAGLINNTNQLLGVDRISGIKTGYIGDASGYCLVSGYKEENSTITVALLGAPTREKSFADSLNIVKRMQELVKATRVVRAGEVVGHYESWWTGRVNIFANEDLNLVGYDGVDASTELVMDGSTGILKITMDGKEHKINVTAEEYEENPSFGERLSHAFGWSNDYDGKTAEFSEEEMMPASDNESAVNDNETEDNEHNEKPVSASDTNITTSAPSDNCTIRYGALMLINPNFTVDTGFIATRKSELISLSQNYGIREGVAGNGDNLLDAEAGVHINEMIKAYEADYPGHTFETRSCFRSVGTNCGRLCAATGASDHHTGLTCDLLDPAYGTSLDTDTYNQHKDWQWLRANSYKYGFIDRFPEAWAGGSMSEPLNVDENGSTGLFETWHFRYVGVQSATEIATGKYNNGQYDSLEHYLKARNLVTDLKNAKCN